MQKKRPPIATSSYPIWGRFSLKIGYSNFSYSFWFCIERKPKWYNILIIGIFIFDSTMYCKCLTLLNTNDSQCKLEWHARDAHIPLGKKTEKKKKKCKRQLSGTMQFQRNENEMTDQTENAAFYLYFYWCRTSLHMSTKTTGICICVFIFWLH